MSATPRPTFPLFGHMSKEPRLQNKVCIISGASRGFGQAIAVRFIEEGAKVVMLSRSSCDETVKLISSIEGITPEYVGAYAAGPGRVDVGARAAECGRLRMR
jgi:NAD(P)-dependent dehydrogenase (short-subunit alcohol dehydrogenase family)